MEQANLPKQEELNALYGSWNPGAYMRGFENQSLADQFRQQAMEANQQGIQKTQQEYAQNELMNPLRVEQMKGTNVGQGNANIISGLGAERAQANQKPLMSEDVRNHAMQMTTDEFKLLDQHAEKLMRDTDPEKQSMGLKLMQLSPAMQAEKRKNDQAMALQKEQSRSHLGGAQIQANAMLQAERERIAAGKYAKSPKSANAGQGILDAVAAGKMNYEKAATAFNTAAQFTEDEELAAKYLKLAGQFEQMQKNKPLAVKEGSMDTAKLANLPTREIPNVIPTTPAIPSQPKAPASAIQFLQQHPEQAAAFKAKYGYLP